MMSYLRLVELEFFGITSSHHLILSLQLRCKLLPSILRFSRTNRNEKFPFFALGRGKHLGSPLRNPAHKFYGFSAEIVKIFFPSFSDHHDS